VGLSILILAVAAVVWILRRRRKRLGPQLSEIVREGKYSSTDIYPYVHVNADGTARELHPNERRFLETPFHPADGGRPYIKRSYAQTNGWGEITGILKRSKLPEGTSISAAPEEDPMKAFSRENQIQFFRSKGLEVVEHGDGRFTVRKPQR
jgi:hypothetical protein